MNCKGDLFTYYQSGSHSELGGYFFDVLDSIENPDVVYEGSSGERLAVREVDKGKFLVVYIGSPPQQMGLS